MAIIHTLPVASFSAFLLCAQVAAAGPCLSVGIEGAAPLTERLDVVDKLMLTGKVDSVIDVGYGHNSEFTDVDVVFVAYRTQPPFPEPLPQEQRGAQLDEYLSGGGAVVITQSALADAKGPAGQFREAWLPMRSGSGGCSHGREGVPQLSFDAELPLFHAVQTLPMQRHTRVACPGYTVSPGSTTLASYPNGRPLVVAMGPVIAINIYHASTDTHEGDLGPGYPADADFPQVFANALYIAAGFDPATACNGDYDDDGLLDEDEWELGTDFQRADTDADDVDDGLDNCPSVANPDQVDLDADGIGDACDDSVDIEPDTATPDELSDCTEDGAPGQTDTDGNPCEESPERSCSSVSSWPSSLGLLAVLPLLLVRRRLHSPQPRRSVRSGD